jgi:hypothetical protein
VHGQQHRRGQADRHVGELALRQLVVRERAAEDLPVRGVVQGSAQAVAGCADRAEDYPEPGLVQAVKRPGQALGAGQHGIAGQAHLG